MAVYTTIAFYKGNVGTSLTALTPVPDEHNVYYADSIRVPSLNKLLAILVYGNNLAEVRLVSPSLNAEWIEDVDVFLSGDSFPTLQTVNEAGSGTYKVEISYALKDFGASPLALTEGERFSVQASLSSGTGGVYAVAFFGDGVPTPATGRIRTIRGTISCDTVANEWSVGQITLSQALAVGNYALVGCSLPNPNVVAYRFIFTGQWWRPGSLGQTSLSVPKPTKFEVGNMGILGTFTNETIPAVELLTTTNISSAPIYLNLIKVS